LTTAQVAVGAVAGAGVIDSFKYVVTRAEKLQGRSSRVRFWWAAAILVSVISVDRILLPYFADVVCNKGVEFAKAGNYNEALKLYYVAASLNPEASDYHFDIGRLLYNYDDLDGAKKEFETTISLSPDHTKAWLFMANVEIDKREYSRALRDLEATERNLSFMTTSYSLLGGTTETEIAWRSSLNLYNFKVLRGKALLGLNYSAYALKEFTEAKLNFAHTYNLCANSKDSDCSSGVDHFRDGGFCAYVGIARAAEKLKQVGVGQSALAAARRLITGKKQAMSDWLSHDVMNGIQLFDAQDVAYVLASPVSYAHRKEPLIPRARNLHRNRT
jgi:tetratricopeptide (TPR) repeat protein